jgi:23S rRNA pseudouridine1911/1915/1917 synthase
MHLPAAHGFLAFESDSSARCVPEKLQAPLAVEPDAAGQRVDQFLASRLNVSRSRVQELIAEEKILVNDAPAKASLKLRGDEHITVLGPPSRPPLRAIAEDIALDILYEDDDLAVTINPPA